MVLLIDNFDSFTYNIFQYIRKLGQPAEVRRNNAVSIGEIEKMAPSHIIISPGPGRPEQAGIALEVIRHFKGKIPILGVCLGHQAIGAAFGSDIVPAPEIFHGKFSEVHHDGKSIYNGLANPFKAVRYHSLIIKRPTLSAELEITAWTDEGVIMGVRHRQYSIEGVQFHPESIGTRAGLQLLDNFLTHRPEKNLIQTAIKRVSSGLGLHVEEAEKVMDEITSGDASPAQIAGFLTALALKGEEVEEIIGFARVMRRKATPIAKPAGRVVVDTCGTGGDSSGTFNISSAAAFVAAGAGVTVAKHGNRSVTSRCGSADLFEALGVNITAPPEVMTRALEEVGIAFLFAPKLHPSMKHAVPVRREIGIRTVFNILGPLASPAGADAQIIGVFSEAIMEKIAKALIGLGIAKAMVVHGSDGLDEITLTGSTRVLEVRDGWIRRYDIQPRQFGLALATAEELKGGDLHGNCEIVLDVLHGEKGPRRDAVVFNAAAAIYLSGLATDLGQGVQMAKSSIDSGAALEKLRQLIEISNA
jgi:anthranilate synthase/phosphoribosyltransferase